MFRLYIKYFLLLFVLIFLSACSSFQTTKNVWKGTKGLWNTYVSPPASIDYDDKCDLSPQTQALANAMMGIDVELSKLERVMGNSDRSPTQQWMERLFQSFPWLSGLAGVKYDGTILGQEPAESLKNLDFNYLLYEDAKQKSRALRADVQPSPLGPEIMLATPLYDGTDFLGIVVAYFEMRALMSFSDHAQDIVILTPGALLWPGKYDFAATPLAGIDWSQAVKNSASGTCTNVNGTFYYIVRYLGNLPLIFAIPQSGDFQEGNGDLAQGAAFFPQERERMAPPPVSEERRARELAAKEKWENEHIQEQIALPTQTGVQEASENLAVRANSEELQPGSQKSVLLRKSQPRRRIVQETDLDGENITVEQPQRQRTPEPTLTLIPEDDSQNRPSPFGPKDEAPKFERPSPFGPRTSQGAQPDANNGGTQIETPRQTNSSEINQDEKSSQTREPGLLPGGRPSPFGPRD